MRICQFAAYLSLAVVAAVTLLLVTYIEREREDEESFRGTARFSDVRVSEGMTLRVEGGRLEADFGEPPREGGTRTLAYGYGAGVPVGVFVPLVALGASTLVLAFLLLALVDHCRDLSRKLGRASAGAAEPATAPGRRGG